MPLQKGETAALRPQVLTLMLAAGFILLIACANLAGLTLVRMLRRTPEVATRLALGASRWQIQKQFWVENLLLAFVGGTAGVAVGFVALRGLLLLLPEHLLPVASVPLDGRVLAFTLLISLLTSVLFGMLPALATRKLDLRSAIASRAATGGDRLRLRQALIVGEIALTVVLLAASGLLIRTLIHLETLPPGFNPDGVMTAKASLDDARFHDPAAFRKLLDESTAAMRQIPGVQNAAVGLSLPYERALNDGVTLSDGKEAGQQDETDVVYVTPGYFDTLQMPVLAGRVFTDADGPNAQHVAVVNQAFARKFYGGANPVGRYINKDTMIVGEVADVPVSSGLYEGAPLMSEQAMYIPAAQVDALYLSVVHVWFQPDWVVRTYGPLGRIVGADAARAGECRPRSSLLWLLQHARPAGQDLDDTACRSGAAQHDGGSGSAAECYRNLRTRSKYRCAEDARDRHPHGSGFHDSPSHGQYRWPGSAGLGARTRPGFGLVRWSITGYAQRALWNRCL